MKRKYLALLFVILISGIASCKKEKSSPVLGKWQQIKLRTYEDSSNVILYDTSYLHPFTNFDYIQFNNNSTCIIGIDHYYYRNSPGLPKVPQLITPVSSSMNYSAAGYQYVLNTQSSLVNFGGFVTADTVFLDGNTLLLHSVFYLHTPGLKLITDSYYTK
jgi:hypothetical protein